jgi:hypothetical protein
MRLDVVTAPGDLVSVSGFGLTDRVEPLGLRTIGGLPILAIGPDNPVSVAQPAPVRSVKIGPYTCIGDSGGPIVAADGTLVAIVSVGTVTSNPYCDAGQADTTGPRLAAYKSLATLALNTAYVALYGDAGSDANDAATSGDLDAAVDVNDAPAVMEDVSVPIDDGAAGAPPDPGTTSDDSSCAVSRLGRAATQSEWGCMALAIALAAVAKGRRNRHGSSS